MDINQKPHKLEGNQVKWWNGLKWLVRETLADAKEAKKLFDDIKVRKEKQKNEILSI